MRARGVRIVVGVLLAAAAIWLVFSPLVVARALHLPSDTTVRRINLRASWGGTLLGISLFIAWLPSLKPRFRALVGLLGWAMAGIGAARVVGFVLDGGPDTLQWVWLSAEVLIATGSAWVLRRAHRGDPHERTGARSTG